MYFVCTSVSYLAVACKPVCVRRCRFCILCVSSRGPAAELQDYVFHCVNRCVSADDLLEYLSEAVQSLHFMCTSVSYLALACKPVCVRRRRFCILCVYSKGPAAELQDSVFRCVTWCVSADDLLEYLSEAVQALYLVCISERSCRIMAV